MGQPARVLFIIFSMLTIVVPLTAGAQDQIVRTELTVANLSEDERELMTYLVNCALPGDVHLEANLGSENVTFQGGLGLAKGWLHDH